MLSPVHNRKIGLEERETILSCLLNANIDWVTLDDVIDAEKTFIELEENLIGRIAGPVSEYIIIYILTRHVAKINKALDSQFVEIGTLFGGSALLMWKALQAENSEIPIVTIDPLDGYYKTENKSSKKMTDLILDIDICEENFRKNMSNFRVPDGAITLCKAYSQESRSIEAASQKPISMLFIDGDHSLEGVQRDINNYTNLVNNEGYILIDNFFDPDWPLVTEGVFAEPNFLERFTPIICHSKLLVLKKQNAPSSIFNIERQFKSEIGPFLSLYRQKIDHLKHLQNNQILRSIEDYAESSKQGISLLSAKVNQYKHSPGTDFNTSDIIGICLQYDSIRKDLQNKTKEIRQKTAEFESIKDLSELQKENREKLDSAIKSIKAIYAQNSDSIKSIFEIINHVTSLKGAFENFDSQGKLLIAQNIKIEELESMISKLDNEKVNLQLNLDKFECSIQFKDESISELRKTVQQRVDELQSRDLTINTQMKKLEGQIEEIQNLKSKLRETELQLEDIKKIQCKLQFEKKTYLGEIKNREIEISKLRQFN